MASGVKQYRFGDSFSNETPPAASSPSGSETAPFSLVETAAGNFDATWSGDWTTNQTGTVYYRLFENLCLVELPDISGGTSTTVGTQTIDMASLPSGCRPHVDIDFFGFMENVSTTWIFGSIAIPASGGSDDWVLTMLPILGNLNIKKTTLLYKVA